MFSQTRFSGSDIVTDSKFYYSIDSVSSAAEGHSCVQYSTVAGDRKLPGRLQSVDHLESVANVNAP